MNLHDIPVNRPRIPANLPHWTLLNGSVYQVPVNSTNPYRLGSNVQTQVDPAYEISELRAQVRRLERAMEQMRYTGPRDAFQVAREAGIPSP